MPLTAIVSYFFSRCWGKANVWNVSIGCLKLSQHALQAPSTEPPSHTSNHLVLLLDTNYMHNFPHDLPHSLPITRSMATLLLVPLKRRKWQPWAETLSTTGHLEPTQLSAHTKETFLKQTHVYVRQDVVFFLAAGLQTYNHTTPLFAFYGRLHAKRYISMIKHRRRAAPCSTEVAWEGGSRGWMWLWVATGSAANDITVPGR